jgi:hypothetical protein
MLAEAAGILVAELVVVAPVVAADAEKAIGHLDPDRGNEEDTRPDFDSEQGVETRGTDLEQIEPAQAAEIAVEVQVVPMGLNMHSEPVPLVRREAATDMFPVLELGVATVAATEVAGDNLGQVEEEVDIRLVLAATC